MVTQDTAAVQPKVKKVKAKKVKKKSKKKKVKGAKKYDSDTEADKLDLEQKIHPLSHYIKEQEELVNQMFLSISGSKLEAMLPPVLKRTPLAELKRLCLHELRGMSKKRILCCINGEVMEGSSGSEEDEDEQDEKEAGEAAQNGATNKMEKRKQGESETPEAYLLKKIKVEPGLEGSVGSEGKSVLELLELEMRARIIKTMLEKGDDGGKKITEDAIAAVMQSATQGATQSTSGVADNAGKEGEAKGEDLDREARGDDREMAGEERRSRRRRSHSRDGRSRRRHHHSSGGRRRTSSRSHRRREDGDETSFKQPKETKSSEKQVIKKKKITRQEFEERMRRAKKNRTYRRRESSEDDEKEEKEKEKEDKPADENAEEGGSKEKEEGKDDDTAGIKTNDTKSEDKADDVKTPKALEGNEKQAEEEAGEATEKEEGEIDSNEEEEGECSRSDYSRSSRSRYSSSSSYSRSSSRSYSRSLSRSPHRGRLKRGRRSRSRSRSKSRKRSRSKSRRRSRSKSRKRRSYSRSYSRSRSPDRRRDRGEYRRQSYEKRRSREPQRNQSTMKDAKKSTPAGNRSPSREKDEDWGHKCDIEFVDSEEDFDDNTEATKKDSATGAAVDKKTLLMNRIERASISFSLQKKPVGIAQSVDLDDLPLKKKQESDDIKALEVSSPAKPVPKEEILISSDSDGEVNAKKKDGVTQSVKEKQTTLEKPKIDDSKEQSAVTSVVADSKHLVGKPPAPGVTSSKYCGKEQLDALHIQENMNSQRNQEELVKKTRDSESKSVEEAEGVQEEEEEMEKKKKKKEKTKNEKVNNENEDNKEEEEEEEKEAVEEKKEDTADASKSNTDAFYKKDTEEDILLIDEVDFEVEDESFHTRDTSKTSVESMENPDDTKVESDDSDASEDSGCESKTKAVSPDRKDEDTSDSSSEMGQVRVLSDGLEAESRVKESDSTLYLEKKLDIDSTETKISEETDINADKKNLSETEVIKTLPRETRKRGVVSKVSLECNTGIVTVEEEKEGKEEDHKGKEELKGESRDAQVRSKGELNLEDLEQEEKAAEKDEDKSVASEQNEEESDNEVISTVFGDMTEDQFYKGIELLSEDEKESEERSVVEEPPKKRTYIEPIRIETGLIRKRIQPTKKIEMIVPEKSWMKRDKKKKEKTRDVLAMEGLGLLRSRLSEEAKAQSSTPDSQVETKTSESSGLPEASSNKVENPLQSVNSPVQISDSENSQTLEDFGRRKIASSSSSKQNTPPEPSQSEENKSIRRIDQDTEIIGVIETSSTSSDKLEDADLGGLSWSMRWLQSEKVQKVVTSSKMFSRVRKKIQKKEKAEKATKVVVAEKVEEPPKPAEASVPVIGSIEEYERLFGNKGKKDEVVADAAEETGGDYIPSQSVTVQEHVSFNTAQPQVGIISEPVEEKGSPVFGSDDDEEDSDEDELWSQIIKK